MHNLHEIESQITTAGGRIKCPRCTARSTRTKQQCGRPALKTSKTQKCQFHGGRSTGPKTAEGRLRISLAHMVHGQATKAVRQELSHKALKLAHLEDMLHLLKMTTARRSSGRRPTGYCPITTIEQARQFVLDKLFTPAGGVG
jgi:hypothetical protein